MWHCQPGGPRDEGRGCLPTQSQLCQASPGPPCRPEGCEEPPVFICSPPHLMEKDFQFSPSSGWGPRGQRPRGAGYAAREDEACFSAEGRMRDTGKGWFWKILLLTRRVALVTSAPSHPESRDEAAGHLMDSQKGRPMSSSEGQSPEASVRATPASLATGTPGFSPSWARRWGGVQASGPGSALPSGSPGQEGETNPRTWLLAPADDLGGHVWTFSGQPRWTSAPVFPGTTDLGVGGGKGASHCRPIAGSSNPGVGKSSSPRASGGGALGSSSPRWVPVSRHCGQSFPSSPCPSPWASFCLPARDTSD